MLRGLRERFGGASGGPQDVARDGDVRAGGDAAALGYAQAGDYRRRVGRPGWYDQLAAMQVSLLFVAGLRETHRLADVGCGSLRAGRMLIPYLKPDRYFGIEPEGWLIDEGLENELGRDVLKVKRPSFRRVADFSLGGFGVEFDYVLCQSVFSHAYPGLLRLGLRNISASLASSGKLLATFSEAEPGDGRPGVHSGGRVLRNGWIDGGVYYHSWEDVVGALAENGMVGRKLDWPHQRQKWFAACLAGSEAEAGIDRLARELRPPRPRWGTLERGAAPRIQWE